MYFFVHAFTLIMHCTKTVCAGYPLLYYHSYFAYIVFLYLSTGRCHISCGYCKSTREPLFGHYYILLRREFLSALFLGLPTYITALSEKKYVWPPNTISSLQSGKLPKEGLIFKILNVTQYINYVPTNEPDV